MRAEDDQVHDRSPESETASLSAQESSEASVSEPPAKKTKLSRPQSSKARFMPRSPREPRVRNAPDRLIENADYHKRR